MGDPTLQKSHAVRPTAPPPFCCFTCGRDTLPRNGRQSVDNTLRTHALFDQDNVAPSISSRCRTNNKPSDERHENSPCHQNRKLPAPPPPDILKYENHAAPAHRRATFPKHNERQKTMKHTSNKNKKTTVDGWMDGRTLSRFMQVALEGSLPSSPSGTLCRQMGGFSRPNPRSGGLEQEVTNLRNCPCSSGVKDSIASQNH